MQDTLTNVSFDKLSMIDYSVLSQNIDPMSNQRRYCPNICEMFLNSSGTPKTVKDQYINVLENLESYAIMILERNYSTEQMFEYDINIINAIRESIETVPVLILKKLEQSKSERFLELDLGEQFTLVKKIFELLDNSQQCQTAVFECVKFQYFLGRDNITQLVTHLVQQREKGVKIKSRHRKDMLYVFDFFYRHVKYFKINRSLIIRLLEVFFNDMYHTNDAVQKRQAAGNYKGLGQLYPGETSKGKLVKKNGEIVSGFVQRRF